MPYINAILQLAAAIKLLALLLLARQILNLRLNYYITNIKGVNQTIIKKGRPLDYVYTRGTLAYIKEQGKMYIRVKTLTREGQIKLI